MTKYIIVNGGVISGVGKGIITASIGKILQEYGFNVTAVKIDPYFNMDAGTLRPTEHGETWVTYDGGEIDQDIGNYERFLEIKLPKTNGITSGQIYWHIINKGHRGDYLGQTVQNIPHGSDEVKRRVMNASIYNDTFKYDIVLVEIGGIVGDDENKIFLSGIKSLENTVGKENILYTLVTYMPTPSHLKEMKTKPTQTAIRDLMGRGIIPDIILCRGEKLLDDIRKKKIETYVNIKKDFVISVPDVDTIYKVPTILEDQMLGIKILQKLSLVPKKLPDWMHWNSLINSLLDINKPTVRVAIICKYLSNEFTDSYLSVIEAIKHAETHLSVRVEITWIDSKHYNDKLLKNINGVIVPGGFGTHGIQGKLDAIKYVRVNNIPFLGLCYGMQLAVIEYARNVHNMQDANTTEIDPNTPHPVVDIMKDQINNSHQLGGTLRLGEYKSELIENSKIHLIYKSDYAIERHRHRYEINPDYVDQLQDGNLLFSGFSNHLDSHLAEYLELQHHPFFIATQSHPELSSCLTKPNPLFTSFVDKLNS